MSADPFPIFSSWYSDELHRTTDLISSACCLSTYGLDGYPDARFVSLKEIRDNGFIITGPLDSRKGREITNYSKVALTFWWTNTQRQVRIQGEAIVLPDHLADAYFQNRPLDARIVSTISKQGQTLENLESLQQKLERFEMPAGKEIIPRPPGWGGYSIKPVRIEFMEFRLTRLHERVLYQLENGGWKRSLVQP